MYKRYIIGIDWAKDAEEQSDMTENEAITVLKCIETHGSLPYKAKEMAIKALEETQEYRKIGTLEECRDAVEKTKPKEPEIKHLKDGTKYLKCPNCKLTTVIYNDMIVGYCPKCGQKLEE